MPDATQGQADTTRWLDDEEQRAWRSYLRAVHLVDDALRRGVTRVYFWWGTLDVKTLVDLEFAYKDKGWRVDTIVSNFRNYIEFYP